MSKDSATVIKDGQLAVATVPQTGTLVGAASEIDATALVETADGLQLCVKTCEVGGGGGGGGGTVDQTYDPTSTNAQSGTAVAEAVAPALKNTATGTDSLTILGTPTNYTNVINIGKSNNTSWSIETISIGNSVTNYGNQSVVVGNSAIGSAASVTVGYSARSNQSSSVTIGSYAESGSTSSVKIAIGSNAYANQLKSIAIGGGTSRASAAQANANEAIQIGTGSNSTAKTLQVYEYQLLDGTTGLIPAARIGTGYDATKTQVLKNVNGTLTWADE